jgi:hypothetical protein
VDDSQSRNDRANHGIVSELNFSSSAAHGVDRVHLRRVPELRHRRRRQSDPDTARFASELCGKADRARISYSVSESSTNANVGWLSGRTASSKGSISASKQYQKHKEPLFEKRAFFELKNAQAIVSAFDGISPVPATYCYLKPDFLPASMPWFEQEQIKFDPKKVCP